MQSTILAFAAIVGYVGRSCVQRAITGRWSEWERGIQWAGRRLHNESAHLWLLKEGLKQNLDRIRLLLSILGRRMHPSDMAEDYVPTDTDPIRSMQTCCARAAACPALHDLDSRHYYMWLSHLQGLDLVR